MSQGLRREALRLHIAQQGPIWRRQGERPPESESTLQAPTFTQDVWHCRRHFRDNNISYY